MGMIPKYLRDVIIDRMSFHYKINFRLGTYALEMVRDEPQTLLNLLGKIQDAEDHACVSFRALR